MDGVGRMSLQNKATIRYEVTHGYTSQSALATLTSCDQDGVEMHPIGRPKACLADLIENGANRVLTRSLRSRAAS